MAVASQLKEYLNHAKVPYTVNTHPVAYTAQERAAVRHVSGKHLAKSVLVTTDRGPVLAVLPAAYLIDWKKLKAVLRAQSVTLAKETEINRVFPDLAVGATPPFGNLYGVAVVIDRSLETSKDIVFPAGSHTESITMRYQNMLSLVKPTTGSFAQSAGDPKPKAKSRTVHQTRPGVRAKSKRKTARKAPVTKRSSRASGSRSKQRRPRQTR